MERKDIDFDIINKLGLKEVFKGTEFDNVDDDMSYLDKLFEYRKTLQSYVFDDPDKGYSTFIDNTRGFGSDKCLKIRNRLLKDIFLWHIDGILFHRDSKCDCAIISNDVLNFVEFKTNAKLGTDKALEETYEKAAEQLSETISTLRKGIEAIGRDFSLIRKKIVAYVVLNKSIPQRSTYQTTVAFKFSKKNRVRLVFENEMDIS